MSVTITSVSGTSIRALGNIPLSEDMYTKGQVETRLDDITTAVSEEIASAVSTAWKAGGSKAPTDLTSTLLVAANEGKVYNMSASGTTDANFIEGSGKTYAVGTDIAVINVGTDAAPVYKFNVLATMDSSVVKQIVPGDGNTPLTPTSGSVTLPYANGDQDGLLTYGDYSAIFGADGLSGTVCGLSDTVCGLSDTVGTLSYDVCGLSGTVGTLSYDVSGLSGTVGTLSYDVSGLSGTVGTLSYDVSSLSGTVSGLSEDVSELSGTVSNLNNFSSVDVLDSSGKTVSGGPISPTSNSDSIGFKAGSNVTLSVENVSGSNQKNIVISAEGSVIGAEICGMSGALNVDQGLIVIPYAATGSGSGASHNPGVVTIAGESGIDDTPASGVQFPMVPTTAQVSGALATKVSGGTLHSSLVGSGLSNGVGSTNNTIYALINALHASDNTAESDH